MPKKPQPIALHKTTRERYLNYALSVITSRALPDVRDGLKPVQRRILYGLHRLRLTPDSRFRKSAQVVGEVMGKYHPHGDSAIYDAMVRMAQPFSLRYTLVDGHGNFGSLDGDNAAAMRYTEVRMAPLAMELLGDLSDRIVTYRPTYDASNQEPAVLPAAFPNLLANGATGIAVGMATNIPPHNLKELIAGCVKLIDAPETTLEELLEIIPAPDFPTGGRILNSKDQLKKIYTTGKGPVEARGEYELEKDGRRKKVVVTSIPYAVNKATLIENIAGHIASGKLPHFVDIRDESSEDIRIVLDLKSGASAEAGMAYLFKHTPLQSRFHVNLTCLVPTENPHVGAPQLLGLREILRHFLDFRLEVVTKRLQLRLEKLEEEIHILEGFEKIFDALDEAIALIRSSRDRKEAAQKLAERFDLDDLQTHAILETKLYKLAQLEIEKIRAELANKREEAARIRALLADERARWRLVRSELRAVGKRFGDMRRSQLGGPDLVKIDSFSKEDYIVEEDVFVIVTRDGWIKRQRSYSELSTIRVRDGDEARWVIQCSTRKPLILFSDKGRAYTMLVDSVPATTGHGEPIQAHFDFADGERVVSALVAEPRVMPSLIAPDSAQSALPFDERSGDEESPLEYSVVALTRRGQATRLRIAIFDTPSTVNGRLLVRLQGEEDGVVDVQISGGAEFVSLISYESRAMTFLAEEIPLLKSPGKGVKAVSLDKRDTLLAFGLFRKKSQGLAVTTNRGRALTVSPRRFQPVSRGARGRLILRRGHIAEVERPVIELKLPEEEG